MTSNLFNRQTDVLDGSFTAARAKLTLPEVTRANHSNTGLLIQNLQVNYRQRIIRLYEVGKSAVFNIAGAAAGTGSMMRLIGPRSISQKFYSKYGDASQAATNTIRLAANVGHGPEDVLTQNLAGGVRGGVVSFLAHSVVVDEPRVLTISEQIVIGENLNSTFGSLENPSD